MTCLVGLQRNKHGGAISRLVGSSWDHFKPMNCLVGRGRRPVSDLEDAFFEGAEVVS